MKPSRYAYHTDIRIAVEEYGEEGKEAINKELKSMLDKDVFRPTTTLELSTIHNKSIIPSLIFIKQKFKPNGKPDKVKARLVAGGHRQDRSLYPDNYSPTVSLENLFIESCIAANNNMNIISLDIASAYLNADMSHENIYMRLDKYISNLMCDLDSTYSNFINKNGNIIVKLNKALYGCLQSGQLWYLNIKETLINFGLIMNVYDNCIFSTLNNDCIVLLYVDDLLIFSESENISTKLINYLKDKYKELKINNGKTHNYLGMILKFINNKLVINMTSYIENILSNNQITQQSDYPSTLNLFEENENIQLLNPELQKKLHTIIAQLLFLSKRARPDIALVVNHLSSRVNKFNNNDYNKILKCLHYLNKTKNNELILSCNNDKNGLILYCYADASHNVHSECKSRSGRIFTLGQGIFSATTTKQKVTSKSSAESELISAADAVSELLGIKNYLISRNYNVLDTILYQDNQASISILKNGINSIKRMKHIKSKYFFVTDYIKNNELRVEWIDTNMMIADFYTKPLIGDKFEKFRDIIMGKDNMVMNE